jgi:uncharacterized protein (UPF0147 family)
MTAPSTPSPSTAAPVDALPEADPVAFKAIFETLSELVDDVSVPRNIRRGAQSAKDALAKPKVARDVRIASAVYVLDDLANDPNLPTHGRTAIWSIISGLESLQ